MRTTLLPVLLLLSVPALAQIPNGGFEAWSPVGTYQDPDGWTTVNALTAPVLSCEEGAPAPEGLAYAGITTHNTNGLGVVPGVIFAGTSAHPGFPCALRPDALTGQWRFYMQGGDVGYIVVGFSRWNPDINFQEPVGAGYTFMSGALPVWQSFSIPITWTSAEMPDTATIQIYTSYGTATDGSALSVDELGFDLAQGMTTAGTAHGLQASFANGELRVQAAELIQEVMVLDLAGRELVRRAPNNSVVRMGLEELPAGLFILHAHFGDGVATRTFVKD